MSLTRRKFFTTCIISYTSKKLQVESRYTSFSQNPLYEIDNKI